MNIPKEKHVHHYKELNYNSQENYNILNQKEKARYRI
jgi:hypothetical protein